MNSTNKDSHLVDLGNSKVKKDSGSEDELDKDLVSALDLEKDGSIYIDRWGDVFDSGLSEYGTVILSKEQLGALRAYTQRQSLQAELKILHELPKTGLTDAVGLYAYQVSKVEYDAIVSTLTQQLKDMEEK